MISMLSCQAIAPQGLADNDIFELTWISLANSEHGLWMDAEMARRPESDAVVRELERGMPVVL